MLWIISKMCFHNSKICSAHPDPGKKMVQKLMYLIERKGVEVGLNYKIHFLGLIAKNLTTLYIFRKRRHDRDRCGSWHDACYQILRYG